MNNVFAKYNRLDCCNRGRPANFISICLIKFQHLNKLTEQNKIKNNFYLYLVFIYLFVTNTIVGLTKIINYLINTRIQLCILCIQGCFLS